MKAQSIASLLFFVLSFMSLPAQDFDISQCGLDSTHTLNTDEAAYFNEILAEQRESFDFTGKRLAFATGNNGHFTSNKYQYFAQDGRRRFENGQIVVNQLIILTEEEKVHLPEVDAIVVSWSKMTIESKKREKLVLMLAERI